MESAGTYIRMHTIVPLKQHDGTLAHPLFKIKIAKKSPLNHLAMAQLT